MGASLEGGSTSPPWPHGPCPLCAPNLQLWLGLLICKQKWLGKGWWLAVSSGKNAQLSMRQFAMHAWSMTGLIPLNRKAETETDPKSDTHPLYVKQWAYEQRLTNKNNKGSKRSPDICGFQPRTAHPPQCASGLCGLHVAPHQ